MKYELAKLPPDAAELLDREGALEFLTWRELPVAESSGQVWGRMMDRAIQEAKANQPGPGERVLIQMLDGPRPVDVSSGWIATAKGAIGKEVRNLTDKEKFCIAFAAHVEVETFAPEIKPDEPRPIPMLHWRTKYPCGIVSVPGGFRVYVKEEA
jgi:hypothetical protein